MSAELERAIERLDKALLGDQYGNHGFRQRIEKLEEKVRYYERRKWFERGVMAVLTILAAWFWKFINLV